MKNYRAPWSKVLVLLSLVFTLVCIGSGATLAWRGHVWAAAAAILVVFVAILFTIRGYTLTPNAILIHRLFWMTHLDLAGLDSVQFNPNATQRSIRLFGNGGLFSFTGWFRNKALGTYRAFVTDPKRSVVLRFPKRTVIVSPSTPEEFVHEISEANPGIHS